MKIYVGVTDNEWFRFLAQRITQSGDEVNFWLPSPEPIKLQKGDLFLFKLHRRPETGGKDIVAGGGIFVSYLELPISLAWATFGEKNGCASYEEMRQKISRYRSKPDNPPGRFSYRLRRAQRSFLFPSGDVV